MSISSISRQKLINQVPTEGNELMQEAILSNFVKSLITENAIYTNGDYQLFICDLNRSEKRLFLSHIVDAEDYEWACENENRLEAFIEEKSKSMQNLIDTYINTVEREMYEDARYNRYDD